MAELSDLERKAITQRICLERRYKVMVNISNKAAQGLDYYVNREYHTSKEIGTSRWTLSVYPANMKSAIIHTDTTFITNEGEKNLRGRFRVLIKDTRCLMS